MPGRRSNYTLLTQVPDDQFAAAATTSFYESEGKTNKAKAGDNRGFDWETGGEYRARANQGNRIGNMYSSARLQRQSSGSSFDESSMSSKYYASTLSATTANEIDGFRYINDDVFVTGGGGEFRGKGMDGFGYITDLTFMGS